MSSEPERNPCPPDFDRCRREFAALPRISLSLSLRQVSQTILVGLPPLLQGQA